MGVAKSQAQLSDFHFSTEGNSLECWSQDFATVQPSFPQEKRNTKAVMPPHCFAASALMMYLLLVFKTFLRSYTDLDP